MFMALTLTPIEFLLLSIAIPNWFITNATTKPTVRQ